jgi:uncharacterized protein YeaO (DUF488 family)
MSPVQIKRAYVAPSPRDGYRVLIDRLWPRGIRKEDLVLDAWAKDLAPSRALRRWFGHDPRRWRTFTARYREELRAPAARAILDELARRATDGPLTIVYGARDEAHNDEVVVRDELERRLRSRRFRAGPRDAEPTAGSPARGTRRIRRRRS